MMEIVDSHFHFWRQADLPWLIGPEVPRIFGAYAPIKRDYPIAEYLSDIEGRGVTRAVYVQANWAPNWFVDEAAFVQKTADETGWPHAIVAYCDMTQADARRDLDRLAAFSLVRGIRQQFHWHENPAYRFARDPDVCRDPNVCRNIGYLADYGWSFDLQVFADQMEGAAELAAACPETTFILQHAGMPEDLSADGLRRWRRAMKQLSVQKNVVCKLSGFGTFVHRVDPNQIRMLVDETLKIFPASRCLFGSNFPIEKIWTTYQTLLSAFETATDDLSIGRRKAIFHDTAKRVYRLN
ncbi:MAG: amidohydrolase family protein [Pseudomonadota bacterium]